MVTLDNLIYPEKRGPITPFIPLITAAVGVGTTVYTQKKAEDAAQSKAASDSMKRREGQELEQSRANAEREREQGQAATREMANQAAEDAQLGSMENMAEQEKMRLEQEKLLAANQQESVYASKFKPGQGSEGGDSASDFLIPKIADDTGLVAAANDEGGAGLVTGLGFNV